MQGGIHDRAAISVQVWLEGELVQGVPFMGVGMWYFCSACVVSASSWSLVGWFCSCGGLIKGVVRRESIA